LKFCKELQASGLVYNVKVFWSTCFQTVQSRSKWFDPGSGEYIFHWDEWINEIAEESTKLPYTLIDPEDFPIKGDEMDLFILKELEKDATKDFTEIAKILGTSQQLVSYHYNKHIIPKKLIESFRVTFLQFDLKLSDTFYFIFKFDSNEKLAKFANSLMDKPFVFGMGKILGENGLIAYLYLPKEEFRRFIEAASVLARSGFLQTYEYVIQDLRKVSRQTISYEYFKNGKWIYDHGKHIERLRSYIQEVMKDRPKAELLLEA
jgi:DNA-binding Lrp family transcriptional regulator